MRAFFLLCRLYFTNTNFFRPLSLDLGAQVMINHFLDNDILGIDVPARSQASTTNSQTSYVSRPRSADGFGILIGSYVSEQDCGKCKRLPFTEWRSQPDFRPARLHRPGPGRRSR